ncbi:MAG TPA: YetF domain-containing protein [Segetibacter sp.]|nr:YetF domain-containing protein [Segetibacter sp.]
MKKEEIHLGDIKRLLFGQTPPEFMIEVFIRTILIYLFLLLVVRLMGKRMASQMTLSELAVMVTLGAIVSPAMQLPDRGLMFGVVVLLCSLAFQRGLNLWEFKNKKVEDKTQGVMSLLVSDGILNLEEMEKIKLTRQQLYAMLREKQILNLAKIERAYLEPCGLLSVFETNEPKAGLSILPPSDQVILTTQHELDSKTRACCNCGHVQKIVNKRSACEVCHTREWSKAYLTKSY